MKKANKQFHTSNSKVGTGDYHGMGIKNKMGTMIDSYMTDVNPTAPKKIGKAPKSLA